MKFKKVIVPLFLAACMSFTTIAFAQNGELHMLYSGDNYVKQYMDNWCWAATGVNLFVAIDHTVPSSKSDKEFLLEVVRDVIDNSSQYSPKSGSDNYERYDVSAGLTQSAEIATKLLHDNGYEDLEYRVSTKDGYKVIRSLDHIMADLKDGCASGIMLEPTAASSNGYYHDVIINGADTTWDDPDDYDVRIFDSSKNSNTWVPYNDLRKGTSFKLNFKKYTGHCEYYGNF